MENIQDWKAVLADPKGIDGKPIAYSDSKRQVLEAIRKDAAEKAFSAAADAGYKVSDIEDWYKQGAVTAWDAALTLENLCSVPLAQRSR